MKCFSTALADSLRVHLADDHIRKLLTQPESGMGFQFVEITTRKNERARGLALNAELLLFERDVFPDSVLKDARDSASLIKAITVRGLSQRVGYPMRSSRAGGAKDAPQQKTKPRERFMRFSAYKNDRRVGADGSLLPGSFATTEGDAKKVKTGKQAVARYALPNPRPAVFVFSIGPDDGTPYQEGIVEAAFGQPGGGVEIYFEWGTQPNTVTGPAQIPEG